MQTYVHPLTDNVQAAIKSAIETKHIIHVVCFYDECISKLVKYTYA